MQARWKVSRGMFFNSCAIDKFHKPRCGADVVKAFVSLWGTLVIESLHINHFDKNGNVTF